MSEELKETREAIKKKAKWRDEETSVSELPPEERRRSLGLIPTEEKTEALKKKSLDCGKREERTSSSFNTHPLCFKVLLFPRAQKG